MKQENWSRLGHLLEKHEFRPDPSCVHGSTAKWFVHAQPDAEVAVSLRFVFKPKMRVLTAHLGWSHGPARDFCLQALQADWPRGFAWLKEAGVFETPCLSLFNLADHLGWRLGGMPVGDVSAVCESAETRLGAWLESRQWIHQNAQALLACYIADHAPFNWRGSNSAIRLAQIAGLIRHLGVNIAEFDQCATNHAALIETDMFGLGGAVDWAARLRVRCGQDVKKVV